MGKPPIPERTPAQNAARLLAIRTELARRYRARLRDLLALMSEWGGLFDCARHNTALEDAPLRVYGLMVAIVRIERDVGVRFPDPTEDGWSLTIRETAEAVVTGAMTEARFVEVHGARWIDP